MRGIVELELDHGRGYWHRNPEHRFVVVIKFRAGHVLHVVVAQFDGNILEFVV